MGDVCAVFAADTHLSDSVWSSRQDLTGDSLFAFEQLVNKSLEYNVPLVLGGDCFELMRQPRPSASTAHFFRKQVDKLESKGIPLYFINGQHDSLSRPFWMNALHSWPQHVGGQSFYLGGKKWFGLDYFESHHFDSACQQVPSDAYGLLLHQTWFEFTDSKLLSSLNLIDLPYTEVAVTGDYHLPLMKTVVQDDKGKLICSPGATHMRSVSEPTQHYVVLLHKDWLEFDGLISRPVLEVEVSNEAEFFDEIPSLVERVNGLFNSHMERTVEFEYGAQTAVPLVLVTDYCDCRAGAILQDHLSVGLVVQRTRKRVNEDETVEEISTDVVDSKQLLLEEVMAEASDDVVQLLRAQLSGEDLVQACMHIGE